MGSIKINLSFIPGSQGLHTQGQSIAGKCKSLPSQKEVRQLSRELRTASLALKGMQDKTVSVFEQSRVKEVEEKVVRLHGEVDTKLIERQVSQIRKEAGHLKKEMESGHISIERVDTLKRHVHLFLKDYCPSAEDRKVIADAKRTLKQATHQLAGEKVVNHFEWMAQQKPVRWAEEELAPGEFEEILDVAALVYQGKLPEARSHFNQLSSRYQQQVQAHMHQLGTELFLDPLATVQALCATVNQLVDNGEMYPDKEEIDELFTGLDALVEQDPQDKLSLGS